ncbi:hypothetical protein ASPNIDRAFT_40315 [Aspergillus niger ATCC 1015]|uniref:Uncharacterized protein n=3 Tax=Aspergillus niger TaxID=5061 RepID=A2R4F7_ASPNC|nr:hypothetical protein An15g00260 [Aspergillus niger]EHA24415.1 hypothetical protein ASPNIDRAFT_40315 [Aspergillus niger ATCC 1015]CAK42195.1 hypothetical protein An15g00260 [Aspergillus niger]SPB45617.1 unnamed protein product [Aspergillus niger]GJP89159.1 hypothetical protein AlacWU_02058 [Aspergillus niger]GKZ96070.1 hypothetical protein AnigIFM59636_010311 [Aspergillus niger]
MGTTSVRRNLFHHHISKRAGSTGPAGSSAQGKSSNGPSGLSSQLLQSASSDASTSLSSGSIDNGEIVVKDKNGSYKLDVPVLPPLVGEDGEEMEGIESVGAGDGAGAAGDNLTAQEKEKILNRIHQSLRNKVAALEEDNWMYEAEVDSRA